MIRAMIRSIRWSLAGSNGRITTRLLLGFRTMPVRRTLSLSRRVAGLSPAVVIMGLERNSGVHHRSVRIHGGWLLTSVSREA